MTPLPLILFLIFSVGCFAQSHSVTLNWQSVGAGAVGVNIYRAPTSTGTFLIIGTVPATSFTYTDNSQAIQISGTVVYYYATAIYPGAESPPSNTVMATIPFVLAPPTGLSAMAK